MFFYEGMLFHVVDILDTTLCDLGLKILVLARIRRKYSHEAYNQGYITTYF